MRELSGGEPLDGSFGEAIDEYIFYMFVQVMNRRNRDFSPVLDRLGLTIPLWRVISTVYRLDGCLMSELAEFTTVDRTTLTRTVDQLVAHSLVSRRTSPQDRRVVRVELTEKGRTKFNEAIGALNAHNTQALAGLSPEELQTLRGLLQKLLRNTIPDDETFNQILHFRR